MEPCVHRSVAGGKVGEVYALQPKERLSHVGPRRLLVTHFKCTPCRARVWREGGAAELGGDLCPGCGRPLEPVERAEQLMGLRVLGPRPPRATIGDHVRAVIALNDAARAAKARRDAGDDPI
jgi:hypothetical protein